MNECYNGTLSRICPKESFNGAETVATCVYLSTAVFNDGAESLLSILDAMHCPYSSFTVSGLRAVDDQRLYHTKRKSSFEEKSARKEAETGQKKGLADTTAEKEGDTYVAGGFGPSFLCFFGTMP